MALLWPDLSNNVTALVLANQSESPSTEQEELTQGALDKNVTVSDLVHAALRRGSDWMRREREGGREPSKFELGLTCDFYYDFLRANACYAWLKPGQAYQDKWGMWVWRDQDNCIRLITPDMHECLHEEDQDQDMFHSAMEVIADVPADAARHQELAELANTKWGLKSAVHEYIQPYLP